MMSSTFLLLLEVNPFLCPFSRLHRVPLHSPSSILPLILFNSMLCKLDFFSKKQRKKSKTSSSWCLCLLGICWCILEVKLQFKHLGSVKDLHQLS